MNPLDFDECVEEEKCVTKEECILRFLESDDFSLSSFRALSICEQDAVLKMMHLVDNPELDDMLERWTRHYYRFQNPVNKVTPLRIASLMIKWTICINSSDNTGHQIFDGSMNETNVEVLQLVICSGWPIMARHAEDLDRTMFQNLWIVIDEDGFCYEPPVHLPCAGFIVWLFETLSQYVSRSLGTNSFLRVLASSYVDETVYFSDQPASRAS